MLERRWLLTALLLSLAATLLSCSTPPGESKAATSAEAESVAPFTNAVIRNDADLSATIDHLLDTPEYQTARWGVAVVSLPDGKLLYGRNFDRLFTPASNMKIYTTAVALDMLGSDYRWRTSVFADQQPDTNGVITGDLILYGRGAPDLVSENRKENLNSLDELSTALANRGVKHITGNVIGDESYFRGEPIGDGWQQNDLQWYFGAEASALTINDNSVDINITPAGKLGDQATVTLDVSGTGYMQVTNNTSTVQSGERYRIGVQRALSSNEVVVWGDIPVGAKGYGASLSAYKPSLWAASLFVRSLKAHGITIGGTPTSRNWRSPEKQKFNPEGKQELAFALSKPLAEIVKLTNKRSINLYAELILRTLGRERESLLGEYKGQTYRGDEQAGTELIGLWLARAGIRSDRLALHDGSGLSRLDLITPESAAGLLAAIARTNSAAAFADSLPIAGKDGTLQGRLTELNGKLAAKTGSIIYDHSLSGYLTMRNGQRVAFSVLSNDILSKNGAIPLIDRLVSAMASIRDPYPIIPNSVPSAR